MKGEEVRKSNVLASPYYEPDTVKHFKWLISFIWERFFFSKNVMPLSAEHHSPIASSFSIWLLSAALHLSRSPVTPMLLPLMHTFWISAYLISWQHLTVGHFLMLKVLLPWHHSQLILLLPPGHLSVSFAGSSTSPDFKILQLCPGPCLHNCISSSYLIPQLSILYMLTNATFIAPGLRFPPR